MRCGRSRAPRSAIAAALERGLYQVPFGRSYVHGYGARLRREFNAAKNSAQPGTLLVPQEVYNWWGYGALAGAGLTAVLSMASLGFGGYQLWALSQDEGAISSFEGQLATGGLWVGGLLAASTVAGLVVGGGLLLPTLDQAEKPVTAEK